MFEGFRLVEPEPFLKTCVLLQVAYQDLIALLTVFVQQQQLRLERMESLLDAAPRLRQDLDRLLEAVDALRAEMRAAVREAVEARRAGDRELRADDVRARGQARDVCLAEVFHTIGRVTVP